MILDHGNLGIWKQDAATSPLGSKILVGTSLRTGLILQCGDFDNSALGENMFSGWSPTPTGAWLISDAIVAWWVLNNFDHEEVADLAPRDFRWASASWFQWCLAFAKGGEPKGQGENHVLERRGVSCSQRRVFVSRKTWTKGSCKWWNVVFFEWKGKFFVFWTTCVRVLQILALETKMVMAETDLVQLFRPHKIRFWNTGERNEISNNHHTSALLGVKFCCPHVLDFGHKVD